MRGVSSAGPNCPPAGGRTNQTADTQDVCWAFGGLVGVFGMLGAERLAEPAMSTGGVVPLRRLPEGRLDVLRVLPVRFKVVGSATASVTDAVVVLASLGAVLILLDFSVTLV